MEKTREFYDVKKIANIEQKGEIKMKKTRIRKVLPNREFYEVKKSSKKELKQYLKNECEIFIFINEDEQDVRWFSSFQSWAEFERLITGNDILYDLDYLYRVGHGMVCVHINK